MTFRVLSAPDEVPNGGLRSYEVFQRERVADAIGVFPPRALVSAEYLKDPAGVTATLREAFSCYRDWVGNSFWIARYDDVTSVFVDDANFETRPKQWWASSGRTPGALNGRDLRHHPVVRQSFVERTDALAEPVARSLIADLVPSGQADLAVDIAARYPLELLARVLGLPPDTTGEFASAYLALKRGIEPDPRTGTRSEQAIGELRSMLTPMLEDRRRQPAGDALSVFAGLPVDPPVSADDVIATLLEDDHETLHGTLANMWCLLTLHPDQLAEVREDRRLVKSAYLEALRHSPPVVTAARFTLREVERFGRLLPKGALVMCSAAAANRDPRVFRDPDRFLIGRKDLCQREPRGQYRADGLATGISFGTGKPSVFPAVPEDRPRSDYAMVRDVAVTLTNVLLDSLVDIRPAPGSSPSIRCLRFGSMQACWSLPVTFKAG